MITWLGKNPSFPPVERALREPNGLLAAGGDLSPGRLLAAYAHGIFPWYAPGEPILWWSPDPRMVLFPDEFRVSRSLARTLARGRFAVRLDTAFAQVIAGCAAAPRPGQTGTWITREMQEAYLRLHRMGRAHSVEAWLDAELAGGLYGVAIGRVFFGESMFSRVSDASKVAAAHLARYLEQHGYAVIDCQMSTPHLASLGAREIARSRFVAGLRSWTREGSGAGLWPADGAAGLYHTMR
ncbi:MAG: leucyl/phenylalanyl-tRNA--protein transferase [Rhodocyclaceae bacterium]